MVISGISKQMGSFLRGREVQILHVYCLCMDSSPPNDPGLLEVTPRSCCRREFGAHCSPIWSSGLPAGLSLLSLSVRPAYCCFSLILLKTSPLPQKNSRSMFPNYRHYFTQDFIMFCMITNSLLHFPFWNTSFHIIELLPLAMRFLYYFFYIMNLKR